ncbi:MFS transporter [Deinococcus deserti]|uniref:Putative Major facilitator superfamily MFS_1 n=1 Tax=Deinococcus deserti (strain DSM 17065 / CIP 109153 / LMG 22923 / VCD115) TaxID=546414 RepID=C1CYG8_DEIDV|nr:MFS transporter [Deinococcus deserti]ACO44989.1 putative Major facilitator superfamily MFS_1 [Deinococcus deserti VCD115]
MNWTFSSQVWLYLASVFSFGLAQAFAALFLNFYLRALGLGAEWQGLLNALPALTLAALSLPAVALARRISNAHTLKIGAGLSLVGTLLLASAQGPAMAILGALVQGGGAALTVVAGSPFMANNSDERNRVTLFSVQNALMTGAGFLGNLLGGRVPETYAALTTTEPDGVGALRAALLVASAFQLLGLLPVLRLRPSGKPAREGRSFAVRDKRTMARLVLPNVLVGLGAGATIPFLNVFIEGKFNVSYASLGMLFAWTSLATAATALLQPLLVGRLGQLQAVLLVQACSLPFLAVLGFAPHLWMVAAALFTRGALMNAAGPVYSAYAMSALPEEDRPMYSAVNVIAWDVGWAVSSLLGGVVRAGLPFHTAFNLLFSWTLLLYASSVLAIYLGLYRPAQRVVQPARS